VTWGNLTETRLARVSAAGQVLDPGGVLVAGATTGVSASAGNGSLQLAWSDFVWVGQTCSYEVFSTHIDPSNVAGDADAFVGPAAASRRRDQRATWWFTDRARRPRPGPRAAARSQQLTVEPVELDAAGSIDHPGYPAVAWNGSVYMAAWNNGGGVVARRLAPNGTPVDAAPFLVMNPGFGPADVEALGGNFLVVGLRCGINCQYVFPIAARVRGLATVLDRRRSRWGGRSPAARGSRSWEGAGCWSGKRT
jgi:hypothetical protein